MNFCEFCGMSSCDDCFYKERMYPRGKIDADGMKPKGKICKLCDRKFIVRQMQLDVSMKRMQQLGMTRRLEIQAEEVHREADLLAGKADSDVILRSGALADLDRELEEVKQQVFNIQKEKQALRE